LGSFNLPRYKAASLSFSTNNRPREGISGADLSDDELCGTLVLQLESLGQWFSWDINSAREGNALESASKVKLNAAICLYLGYLRRMNGLSTPSLELLLNGGYIRAWIDHMIKDRGIGFHTLIGYLSCLSKSVNAMRSMKLKYTSMARVAHLISDIKSVTRQLGGKASASKGQKDLVLKKTRLAAISNNDQEALSQMPGSLKYGLLIQHSESLAEKWIKVRMV
jgi:hypothetical protein